MKICPYCGFRGKMLIPINIDETNYRHQCPECGKEFNEDEN